MIHGRGKSDSAIVAMKPANKADQPTAAQSVAEPIAAEPVERRAGTKGNADWQNTRWAQSRESVSRALECIRKVARERKQEKFTSLLHHISIDLLGAAFFELKRDAAPGIDGLTWRTYEADLDRNITDLHERVHRGAYRALPSRRKYILKADGKQRPLAIAALDRSYPTEETEAADLTADLQVGYFATGYSLSGTPRSWNARSWVG